MDDEWSLSVRLGALSHGQDVEDCAVLCRADYESLRDAVSGLEEGATGDERVCVAVRRRDGHVQPLWKPREAVERALICYVRPGVGVVRVVPEI